MAIKAAEEQEDMLEEWYSNLSNWDLGKYLLEIGTSYEEVATLFDDDEERENFFIWSIPRCTNAWHLIDSLTGDKILKLKVYLSDEFTLWTEESVVVNEESYYEKR